jgi:desulfoferrodoxin (superoxide reductase-like protein)
METSITSKKMAGEDNHGPMVTNTKEDSSKVFLKVKESIPGPMEQSMKVSL